MHLRLALSHFGFSKKDPNSKYRDTFVSHCRYADDPVIKDMQFENLNFDSDNKYDPENSDYGTPEERKVLMNMIQSSIDKNNSIKLGSFCNVPESVVKIPIKKNATNCYTRQYPLAKSYYPVIKEQ